MKRTPRIDQDAYVKEWPLLFETETPTGKDFVDRADELVVDLSQSDLDRVKAMANRYNSTLAGLILQILFEFLYGYYLLAKMRRQKFGLFKDFPPADPAAGTDFSLHDELLRLRVPRRLWLDLEAIAQREGVERHDLAGLIVRRYVEGHSDSGMASGA